MKLIICSRDIDDTLIEGDLISWHDDDDVGGKSEGLFNALTHGVYNQSDYLANIPFIILNAPLITLADIRPIVEDVTAVGENDGEDDSIRNWKIDISMLERRPQGSFYNEADMSATKARWGQVITGQIRRDTFNAYREITRADLTIDMIMVAR